MMLRELFNFTPLGRADNKIRKFLEQRLEGHHFEKYNHSLRKYRNAKIASLVTRLLLYASLITSLAATFNLNLSIINKVASYLGFTVILILYGISTYFAMLFREEYQVQRDILIATAAEQRIEQKIEEKDSDSESKEE